MIVYKKFLCHHPSFLIIYIQCMYLWVMTLFQIYYKNKLHGLTQIKLHQHAEMAAKIPRVLPIRILFSDVSAFEISVPWKVPIWTWETKVWQRSETDQDWWLVYQVIISRFGNFLACLYEPSINCLLISNAIRGKFSGAGLITNIVLW